MPWTSGTVATPAVFSGNGISVSAFGGALTPARWCSGGQVNCPTLIDDPDLLWAQLASATQQVSGLNVATTGDTTRVPLRINLASSQLSGSYTGSITVTAIAQP